MTSHSLYITWKGLGLSKCSIVAVVPSASLGIHAFQFRLHYHREYLGLKAGVISFVSLGSHNLPIPLCYLGRHLGLLRCLTAAVVPSVSL